MKSFYTSLRESGRIRLYSALALSVAFSVGLVAFRILKTQQVTYVFYLWNLFLAILPFGASTLVVWFGRDLKSPVNWVLLLAWLIFLPNAPYMITDLFHLRPRPGVPLWYDTLLTLSFAWNGMVLFFLSLGDVQEMVNGRFSKFKGWMVALGVIFLCGFGIYLGRYLRFNSWDLVHDPLTLLQEIADRVIHPLRHGKTWGVTGSYAAFLTVTYLLFRAVTGVNVTENKLESFAKPARISNIGFRKQNIPGL
ncbi:MAG: DUF1361 domain-containing protein [Bacteroidia bacterium]|nr:DUF1361 domain-containing protein [Bacteroidia bacterium]